MVIAYVGSGGKTSLIKRHAEECRRRGLKVLITTSTHMYMEEDTLASDDVWEIIRHMEEAGYVMAGIACGDKIGALSPATYCSVCAHADVVLLEADGSRQLPLKLPNENEPVIYDNVDEIIVVCGLWALGKAAGEVCHRIDLVKKFLGISDETIIQQEHIYKLVMEGYIHPLRKKYPSAKISVHANHNAAPEQQVLANLLIRESRK